jgi:DNA-binding NarL/FixJ family response regulator
VPALKLSPAETRIYDVLNETADHHDMPLTHTHLQLQARALGHAARDVARGQHPQPPDGITPPDVLLLRLVADGLNDTEIGYLLGITPSAARSRVSRLQRRFGAASRVRLVALAFETGTLAGAPGEVAL